MCYKVQENGRSLWNEVVGKCFIQKMGPELTSKERTAVE